ncbi:MAG TPA: P1 family peptidase [Terriglobia bacterium]|nr:P1 family peptidase [Terriglobia bacterium]
MSNLNRRDFGLALTASAGLGLASLELAAMQDETSKGSFTDVGGIKVGHFTDSRRSTGCTAILFEDEAAVGVDYDGSAPGDHLGVMLQPASPIDTVHGILLAGAGPFGLAAVQGMVRYLEEHKRGFDWGISNLRIPIVVGAVIDDLALGDARIRPGPDEGYKACQAASSSPVKEGNVGAGAGATVGKMLVSQGMGGMKAGIGCSSRHLGNVIIGALVVANSVGDIRDWRNGKILAGARRPDDRGFVSIVEVLAKNLSEMGSRTSLRINDLPFRSTTLALVATNVDFNKTQLTKIAMMASTGAARVINPYHTTGDGDSTFAISTNKLKADIPLSAVGALAAEVVSEATVQSVKMASSIDNWPAYRDYTMRLG